MKSWLLLLLCQRGFHLTCLNINLGWCVCVCMSVQWLMLFQQLYGLPRGISCIPLKLMLFFTSPLLRLHIAKIAEFYPTLGRRYGNNFFGDTFFSPSSWRQNYGNSITVKNVCYKTIYRSIFHIACRHVWWCSNNWLPVNVIWLFGMTSC